MSTLRATVETDEQCRTPRCVPDFFKDHGHAVVPSSSLVPATTHAALHERGMVQFKDVFSAKDKRAYTRAASSQRCVRAGGKPHTTLENVGYTPGTIRSSRCSANFSFGDYFKREAIRYAWGLRHRHARHSARAPVGHGV